MSEAVAKCLTAAVTRLKLPRPKTGKPTSVAVEINYETGGDAVRVGASIEDGFGPPAGAGNGSGSATAATAPAAPPSPASALGDGTISGELDEPAVHRIMKVNLPQFRACYDKQRAKKPALAGTVTAKFMIGATGAVTKATASGIDKTVEECVATAIKSFSFPQPKSGEVQASFPLRFAPPATKN